MVYSFFYLLCVTELNLHADVFVRSTGNTLKSYLFGPFLFACYLGTAVFIKVISQSAQHRSKHELTNKINKSTTPLNKNFEFLGVGTRVRLKSYYFDEKSFRLLIKI